MAKGNIRQKSLFLVFNSFFLTAVLILIQIVAWIWFYEIIDNYSESNYAVFFQILVITLTLSMIGYIILKCPHNSYQIAWLILLALVPTFALIMYVVLRMIPGTAHLAAQISERKFATDLYLENNEQVKVELGKRDKRYVGLFEYLKKKCHYPTYYTDDITYYPTGEQALEAMFVDLEGAKSFIFMEYFIVSEGAIIDRLFEILKRKVEEGVEVRFMYDGFCTLKLPRNFLGRCQALGIQCAVFSPLRPILSSYQNNRDHRKITVIDGEIGYTGGYNLADEYANLITRFGYWKDAGLRITGNGVQSLTGMFLQAWDIANGWHTDAYGRYMKVESPVAEGGAIISPYADAPENDRDTASDVYCQILDLAEDYVHIMTPYLILDERMRRSLEFAAERGVDVTILLPHIPDKKIIFMIARGYYPELIKAGIKIYEYTPGFLHSKLFVSDGCIASVGTINLDYRSLFLHFENSVLVYDEETADFIEADFNATLAQSERMYLKTYSKFPWYKRAFGRLMRVFGPLM